MKKIKLLLVFLLILLFVKWMGPTKTDYVNFQNVFSERDNFRIRVGLYGELHVVKHFLYKTVSRGSPYRFHITAIYQNIDDFTSIKVLGAKISELDGRGIRSISELLLLKEDFGPNLNPEGYTVGSRFKNLELTLQPYLVEGQMEVCSNAECWIEEFSVILNYATEFRYGFSLIDGLLNL